jgi:hypothetical protein
MQTLDPSTGPVPREVFAKLGEAPFGAAVKIIRRYDPLYGRVEGKKIKWTVLCETNGRRAGTAEVEATSEKAAEKAAENLSYDDVEWDWDEDDFTIISIKPAAETESK